MHSDLCRTHIADQTTDFGKAFDDRVVIAVAHGGIHGLSDQGTDFIACFDHAAFDAQVADRSALHHVEQTNRILLLIDMQIIDDMPCAIERAAETVHGGHAGKRDILHLDIGAHPVISCGTSLQRYRSCGPSRPDLLHPGSDTDLPRSLSLPMT